MGNPNWKDDPKFRWWEDPEQLALLHKRFQAAGIDRRRFIQICLAAGGTAALAPALAACGGGGAEETPAGGTTGGGGTTPTAGGSPAAGATEATGNEELAAEQVFRWNTENEPLSMDFNKDLYCMGIEVLWGCLGQFNENLEAVPDIAEKWEPNEDGSVWTFHIRKDTKWSNGDPVTAHDFEYAWKRQLDPATAATYAGFLYDLKNGEAFNQGKSGVTRDDVGVKAIDDYTLEATLEGPRAYFPVLTAYYASIPVHKASIDKYGDKWTEPPNGVFNGPFKLTEWKHNERLVAEKNENYWNAKNIHITRIERPVISADTAPQAYENDEIDYLQRINLGDLDRYQNDPELSKQMIKYNQFGTWYLVPDPNFEPFKLKQVRQAMAHAIDRDTIVNKVLKGLGTPAYTMTPPGMPGYNPNKYDELTRYEGPDAKKYLQGTPYEGGKNWPKLTMTMREETDAEKAAGEAIINMLKQNLGMDLELEVGEPKETYERMYKHEIPLMWVRWYIDYPDPNNTMYLVWYSKLTSGHRHSWSNPQFDDLITKAAGETDQQKRMDLYRQADEIMLNDYAAIFVYNPWSAALVKPWVKGMPKNKNGDYVPYWNVFVRMEDRLRILKH